MIKTQEEFNQRTVNALRNLYLLSIGAKDCGEDESVRSELAALDAYAWRDVYASMPEPQPPITAD